MTIGQKFQEFFYSLTTNDKYSDFDSSKSFNRVNKPDSESNLLYSHHNQSTQALIIDDNDYEVSQYYNKNTLDGVHEVKLAWRHVKNWLDKNSPDLLKTLQDKCTDSDLNDFQNDLKIKLPQCLVEFFKLTDGQSSIGNNDNDISGLIFGLKLMALDEIVGVTENWRKVADILNNEMSQLKQSNKLNELSKLKLSHYNENQVSKKFTSGSESSSAKTSIDIVDSISRSSTTSSTSSSAPTATTATTTQSSIVLPQQRCIPPGSIHETFAHPMWIPLVTDEVGNYIGIDLSPPPNGPGNWGQVILFGREFDFKFKIADNFGDFLLIFANDLETGNWDLKYNKRNNDADLFVGDEGDLVFIDKLTNKEIPYFDVLKTRAIKKWTSSLQKSDNIKSSQELNLINQLNSTKGSILNLPSNYNSIDSFINRNLSVIEKMDENPNTNPGNSSNSNHTNRKPEIPSNILKSKNMNTSKPSIRSPLVNELVDEDDEDEEQEEDIVDDSILNENTVPVLANIKKFADGNT